MYILKIASDLESFQKKLQNSGEKLFFIPTMGALHDGHISLVDEARKIAQKEGVSPKILVSVFVNPTQFEKPEDLEKYPRTLDADLKKLKNSGVDGVFIPEISDMYPQDAILSGDHKGASLQTKEIILPDVFSELEGATREGHFEGVFQVVHRLFSLVQPDYAVFGQKDFQQVMLIEYLQKTCFPEISIITAPLFREKSGLAYSSRNMHFSPQEKSRAVVLFQALSKMKEKFLEYSDRLSAQELKKIGYEILASEKLVEKIHYLSLRDQKTFRKIDEKKYPQKGDIMLLSVEFSGVHLIDNMIL